MVSFAEPARLWLLLLPLAGGVAAALRVRYRIGQQRRLASPAVWRRLMGGTPATGGVRMLAWCAAAAAVVLALARPQWGELPQEASIRTRDLVVALDVSDSMLCPDVRPDRLRRALEMVTRALPGLDGNRVGVVVFAGDAYPLVPATRDLNAVAAFLQAVQPGMVATPGSNLERAVRASLELLPADGDGRVVALVTDGENLQGDLEAATGALADAGVELLAIVAGTEVGGPIPVAGPDGGFQYKRDADGRPVVTKARPDVLAQLAEGVGGGVLEIDGPGAEQRFVTAIEALRTREAASEHTVRRVERFQWPLVVAALLAVGAFLVPPWRRRIVAVAAAAVLLAGPAAAQGPPVAVPPSPVADGAMATAAPSTADPEPPWWQRWIPGGARRYAREAARAWRQGDTPAAVEGFAGAAVLAPDDPERWFDLGTAVGATGDLQAAVPMLSEAHAEGVSRAAYNAGTAALQQGAAEQAVRWLREAVVADPDDAAAKRNYELALRMLEEQQRQQQNDDEQDQDEQDQENQQSDEQEQQPGTPTPTPTSGGQGQQQQPTPTPSSDSALLAALERAEAEAREAMRTPTPAAGTVEKDW